jgi:hypothetical protein
MICHFSGNGFDCKCSKSMEFEKKTAKENVTLGENSIQNLMMYLHQVTSMLPNQNMIKIQFRNYQEPEKTTIDIKREAVRIAKYQYSPSLMEKHLWFIELPIEAIGLGGASHFQVTNVQSLTAIGLSNSTISALKAQNSVSFKFIGYEKYFLIKYYEIPIQQLERELEIPIYSNCTFLKTGKSSKKQKIWCCKTCGLLDNFGCCQSCAEICHKGHDLIYTGKRKCFCDCGAGNCVKRCICGGKFSNRCTYRLTKNADSFQKSWFCYTCGLVGNRGVCESCCLICHQGHELVYAGEQNFVCNCGAGNGKFKCNCLS